MHIFLPLLDVTVTDKESNDIEGDCIGINVNLFKHKYKVQSKSEPEICS